LVSTLPTPESTTATPAVILSGNNTYTGATTITAGILQIGDGGSSGTLGTGPVTNNDTLTFNRSDNALVVTAPIGGTGILNQIGTGTTTLSGVNTYTGNTNVTAGTLTLSDTGTIGTTSTVAVAEGATANINGVLTGSPTANVNGTMNIGPTDASNHTAGTTLVRTWSALTLGVNGDLTAGSVSLGTGTDHTVLVINGNGSTSGLTFGGSTGAWSGKLDLGGNNGLVVKNGSLSDITNQLKQGFNAGAGYWNGTAGIVSSAAAANTRFLTTLGVAQGGGTLDGVSTAATDVLVKYTYYGDADLNGTVNGADYQQIDMGFGAHLTGWSNGDFNYDGVVNGSDFALIDNTFNQILASGASPLAIVADPANLGISSSNLIASPLAAVSTSAVPEPTTLGLIGIGAAGVLGRRRRRQV
jgi:autotransporter-associated beta strand protein